jgi:predicted HicB family RNase H-like nuclease
MSEKSLLKDANARRGTVLTMTPRRQAAPVEDSTILVSLNARVPENLWRRLRAACAGDGRSIQTFIAEAVEEHLHLTKRRDV